MNFAKVIQREEYHICDQLMLQTRNSIIWIRYQFFEFRSIFSKFIINISSVDINLSQFMCAEFTADVLNDST